MKEDCSLGLVGSIEEIQRKAIKIGFSQQQTNVIASLAQRKNLVPETQWMLEEFSEHYHEKLEAYNQMMENAAQFNDTHKKLRTRYKNIPTFGSLSTAYSLISPIHAIQQLLAESEDAKAYKQILLPYGEYDQERDGDINEFLRSYEDSQNKNALRWEALRFISDGRVTYTNKKKKQALLQDLRMQGVEENMLEELYERIGYADTVDIDYYAETYKKKDIIDASYIFFSWNRGKEFIEEWKDSSQREQLSRLFLFSVSRDAYVNPNHISMPLESYLSEEYIRNAEKHNTYTQKHIEHLFTHGWNRIPPERFIDMWGDVNYHLIKENPFRPEFINETTREGFEPSA